MLHLVHNVCPTGIFTAGNVSYKAVILEYAVIMSLCSYILRLYTSITKQVYKPHVNSLQHCRYHSHS
jgi:hypothetical protein